ncbi:MAG: peptidylprolyl isomerase, partial [Planctomycetota bacterium]
DEKKKIWVHNLQRLFVARQELRRRGLKLTEDDLDYQIRLASSARTTKLGEVEFPLEKILEKLGRDLAMLKKQYGFRRVAMLTKMVRDDVDEKKLRALFDANPARFGDGVPKASHILIKVVDEKGQPLTRRDQRKAKELAESIHKRLTRGREDFAKLAGECSQDAKTKDRGGELGYQDPARRSKLDSVHVEDVVARTAYALKAGEVSRPVFSEAGWHVVKVTEVHRVKFEDAKPLILAAAIRARRNALEAALVKKTTVRLGPARF